MENTWSEDAVSFPLEEQVWEEKEQRAKAEQARLDHQKERERMQEMVKERAITRVCHFTRYENLKSIHQWGIRSTRFLQGKKDIEFLQNDPDRHDNHLGISCSIQFPNARLLYKWMKIDYPDAQWIMFYIDPSVIWENGQDNIFCQTNAASRDGDKISGLKGFKEIFKNEVQTTIGPILRDEKLALHSPTDVQAEMLLDHKIGWEKIQAIVTNDKTIKEEIIKDFPNVKVIYDPKAFDFGHIKRARESR